MTEHVSDRDREQVVIDLENLKTISLLRHSNMGPLPPELNQLLVAASHFVCRLLAACTRARFASRARVCVRDNLNPLHQCWGFV